jgi:hypothetical protein
VVVTDAAADFKPQAIKLRKKKRIVFPAEKQVEVTLYFRVTVSGCCV